jgi:hypothetical protein
MDVALGILFVACFTALTVLGLLRGHELLIGVPKVIAALAAGDWRTLRPRTRDVVLIAIGAFTWAVLLQTMRAVQAVVMPLTVGGLAVLLASAAGGAALWYLLGRAWRVGLAAAVLFSAALLLALISLATAAPVTDAAPERAPAAAPLAFPAGFRVAGHACDAETGQPITPSVSASADDVVLCGDPDLALRSLAGHWALRMDGSEVWIPSETRLGVAAELEHDDGSRAYWGYARVDDELIDVVVPRMYWGVCPKAYPCSR